MRSLCTGESWVERPLPANKFTKICIPEHEIDWYCTMYGVSKPKIVRQTKGTKFFRGSYNNELETLNYTKPFLGLILHELAHHICHKLGLNGRGNYHDSNFGRILQEMIDDQI